MRTKKQTRLAVLGAGPIGIEAAVRAVRDGYDVQVFEKGVPGAHVDLYKHVTFFSPWSLNRSPWGKDVLESMGRDLLPDDEFPTARDYMQRYLEPLAGWEGLRGRIHTGHEVLSIARRDAFKDELIGKARRGAGPFLLLIEHGEGQRYLEADIVLDTTGVYANPNHFGPGGMRAIGELEHDARIEPRIPDVMGRDRAQYANKHTLLIGGGHSAATSLKLLHVLKQSEPATQITWLYLPKNTPFKRIEDDPLPQRDALSAFGNNAAAGQIEGVTAIGGARVLEISDSAQSTGQICVRIERPAPDGKGVREQNLDVDRIVANVGYRPDLDLFRELQVHQCYASEGPMKLAASLLAASGDAANCLDQPVAGFDALVNPEPDFFVLGAKSYGRNSNFLLRVGFEQIEAVFSKLQT